MSENGTTSALRAMLREQLRCVGRVAARHQLPSDALWEIAKGFEVIYIRKCHEAGGAEAEAGLTAHAPHAEPHPGLSYLLAKLDREEP